MMGLGIRQLVSLNETKKKGVLMKISRRGTELCLTIRLHDGTWMKNLDINTVKAEGGKATLSVYLRLGDILLTRYGVAIVRGLDEKTGEISVEFRGPHKYHERNRAKRSTLRKQNNELLQRMRRDLR